jgi:hypothetical protein
LCISLTPMRLLRFTMFLLLAAIFIAEPVVHTHPLSGDGVSIASQTVCAMCAVAAQQVTVVRTNIAAPLVVTSLFVAAAPLHRSLNERRPLASRAPPAT